MTVRQQRRDMSPLLITPPDSQIPTRDPTPHIEDPHGDTLLQYHTSPPPRTDVNNSAGTTAELRTPVVR